MGALGCPRVDRTGAGLRDPKGADQPRSSSRASASARVVPAPTRCPPTTGKDFSGKQLADHNFAAEPAGSLRGANFAKADLRGAIFAGQDLTGASFDGAALGPGRERHGDDSGVDFTRTVLDATCFLNAHLERADFRYAAITCAEFSGAYLDGVRFGPRPNFPARQGCRTRFADSHLDARAIPSGYWGKVDFTDANLTNVKTLSLQGKDLTGAWLGGNNSFSGVDMSGANLSEVDFSGANLVNARLDRAALNGANFKGSNLTSLYAMCTRLYGSSNPKELDSCCRAPPCMGPPPSYSTQHVDFTGATLAYAHFDHAILDSAVFAHADLTGAFFQGASLQGVSLQGVESLLRADFTRATFSNANLNEVKFVHTILNNADFTGLTMKGTVFSGVSLSEAIFTRTKLQSVSFSGAILEVARFDGAEMLLPDVASPVDFSCARLGGASFKDSIVRGSTATFRSAVMPPDQSCCPAQAGFTYCGTSVATGAAYGPVTYPVLKGAVTCPNGVKAVCAPDQWKIRDWRTSECGDGNDPVWTEPNCGGPPGEVVTFNDVNLKACIVASLPGHPKDVPVAVAATVTRVECAGRGIADLTGLERFERLEQLDLSDNQLPKSIVLGASTLRKVLLSNNKMLAALDMLNAKDLVLLEASGCSLAGPSSVLLYASAPLQVLDLSGNQLRSFDLTGMSALQYVDLSFNGLTSVLNPYTKDLSGLTSLSYLDLSRNELDLGGVGALDSLQTSASVNLECNPRLECKGLSRAVDVPEALLDSGCAESDGPYHWKWRDHPRCDSLKTTPRSP